MPLKIGQYIRVSTEEQAMRVEGSLDSQKHRLDGFVDIKNMQTPDWGLAVEKYIDDGYSAENTNRPAFQRMLKDLRSGRINTVLVTDLSRLSRSIRDFCALLDLFKELRVKFLSIKDQFDTSTAVGEMMLFNMINLAQFERRQISERVSLNFHSRAMRGLRNGGAAVLGFYVDPENKSVLKVHERDAQLVKTVFDTFLLEGSLYPAAAKLREKEIPTRPTSDDGLVQEDSTWNTQLLGSMLRNFNYAGLREVNKANKFRDQNDLLPHEKYQVVKAAWPEIIDEATFFTVQKMLDDNSGLQRSRRSKSKSRFFLLTQVAKCGECGRPLVGSTGHGRVKEVRYYIHRPIEGKPVTCQKKRWPADEIENIISNHLTKVVAREGYLDGVEAELAKKQNEYRASIVETQRDIEKKISHAESALKKLIKLQIDTDDDTLRDIYGDQLKENKDLREQSKRQLEEVQQELGKTLPPSVVREVIEANLKDFQKAWSKAAPALKKQLLRSVIARFVLKPECIEIYYHSDRSAQVGGLSDDSSQPPISNLVDISNVRNARKKQSSAITHGVSGQTHYAKVSGWYIERNG